MGVELDSPLEGGSVLMKLYKSLSSLEREALKEVIEARIPGGRGAALMLSWLLLRAASGIISLFSGGSPPPAESVAALEAFLADVAVEAMLFARRGLLPEREAVELAQILTSEELVSLLGECKRGSCKPVKLYEIGLRLFTLGEVLVGSAGEPPRACLQG